MNPNSIEFDLSGIASQLKERLLAVPIYQRPYSWKDEQVTEFWSDLYGAFNTKNGEYFLGTIVLTRQGTPGRDTIIDGQQRLATTVMLLAAIRDEYNKRGDSTRANIVHSQYLVMPDLQTGSTVGKIRLSNDDDSFFSKLVVHRDSTIAPTRTSHRLIAGAYTILQGKVSDAVESWGVGWAERLFAWADFLRTQARAIFLEVPTEADAFLIFETLNDRGADLTVADLLKNYLFGRAGDRIDVVRDGWLQAVGALEIAAENATFTMFLRHYWSSRRGTIRERELYKDIRDNVTSAAQAIDFIDELQQAARHYAALLNSDHDHWSTLGTEAKGHIESFLRLELEQVRPLMLAAMQHFTPGEMKRLLRCLTAWGVRGLFVGGIGGGSYERTYGEAAVQIRKGAVKTTEDLFAAIDRSIPTDEDLKAAITIARVPRSNLARYYLLALERGLAGEKEPELVPNANEEQVNLEHVLPKNASDADWGAFTKDERKDFVNRLGNLALLQKGLNGKIGNKAFTVKKPILAASAFKLTNEIGREAAWSAKEIQARQKRLADLAVSVWPRTPG